MIEHVLVVVFLLSTAAAVTWALWLRAHPREVVLPAPPPQIIYGTAPAPVPVQPPLPERLPVQPPTPPLPPPVPPPPPPVVRPVEEPPPDGTDHLRDPQALPDGSDSVPDSLVDGVRLGRLSVRAAAVRGVTSRRDGGLRRQVAALSIVDTFQPAVLLSVVAAGDPGARIAQIGAAQAARSIRSKLTERARDIDEAWRRRLVGDDTAAQHLTHELRSALADLGEPLAEAARRRDLPPAAAATQLTCVLTRLGDAERRQHLAFGVGNGIVLVADGARAWRQALGAVGGVLPDGQAAMTAETFETGAGELVVLCSGTTATLLEREAAWLGEEWASAPGMARFLYQLGVRDEVCRDDRAAVCLWEDGPHGA